MGRGACGLITQTVEAYTVIGKICQAGGGSSQKGEMSSLLVVRSTRMCKLPFGIKLRHMVWGRNMLYGGRIEQQIDNYAFAYSSGPKTLSLLLDFLWIITFSAS